MKRPILIERLSKTGEHIQWELIDSETKQALWAEGMCPPTNMSYSFAVETVTVPAYDCSKLETACESCLEGFEQFQKGVCK